MTCLLLAAWSIRAHVPGQRTQRARQVPQVSEMRCLRAMDQLRKCVHENQVQGPTPGSGQASASEQGGG